MGESLQIDEMDVQGQSVAAQGASVQIPRFVPAQLQTSCSPDSIQVGASCGMADMCGLDPCLCGAADSWGACACNGLQDAYPEVAYTSSNPAVATVEQDWWGNTVVVAHGEGDAVITATATLQHYDPAELQTTVHVEGLTGTDYLAGAGIAGALAVIALGIALVCRTVKRRRASFEQRMDAQGNSEEGAEDAKA